MFELSGKKARGRHKLFMDVLKVDMQTVVVTEKDTENRRK